METIVLEAYESENDWTLTIGNKKMEGKLNHCLQYLRGHLAKSNPRDLDNRINQIKLHCINRGIAYKEKAWKIETLSSPTLATIHIDYTPF